MQGSVNKHKGMFLFEGVLFIILGVLALVLPGLFTIAAELLIGWLFLFGGVFQAIRSFKTKEISGFWVSLISSALYIIAGLLLLFYPLKGILTLTFLLAYFFFLEGIAQIVFAVAMHPAKSWGWLLISGILAIAMAFIIWSGWPGSSVWVLGILVGINLLFYGFSQVFIASSRD
ncbi:HdeD family acid-resistance protein [Chlamydiales bacterium]|nr:HdeD family acid-resistance protein [Chlamydiales bacterium]